jgi:hypothetical protein
VIKNVILVFSVFGIHSKYTLQQVLYFIYWNIAPCFFQYIPTTLKMHIFLHTTCAELKMLISWVRKNCIHYQIEILFNVYMRVNISHNSVSGSSVSVDNRFYIFIYTIGSQEVRFPIFITRMKVTGDKKSIQISSDISPVFFHVVSELV